MNNLLSQDTTTQRLAEQSTKQKILQEKLDSLVKRANENLMCGAECKKQRTENELQKKYLAAKDNLQDAPKDLNNAEKNYFTFVNGKVWYNKFQQQKNSEIARLEAHKLNSEFMKKHDDLKKDIQYFDSQNAYIKNMDTLLKKYRDSNKQLKKKVDDNAKNVQTSSRLSFYYEDDIETINDWTSVLTFIYWIIFSALVIKFIVLDTNFTDMYLWLSIAFFAVFPFVIFPVHDFLKNTVKKMLSWFDLLERRVVA